MDNYQRLFKELRPENLKSQSLSFSDEELNEMIESEWLKNKNRALIAYREEQYEFAISYIDKAIQENIENIHLYCVRARIKEGINDFTGAILDYKQSLFISGKGNDSYATYNQIAINFLYKKDFKDALVAFDIAIELKTKLIEDKLDESIMPYFIDGVVKRIDFERIYTNRANVKLNLHDYNGCANDCSIAIKINPEYSNSYYIYGVLMIELNKNESAFQALKIAEAKGNKNATNTLSRFFKK